MLRAIVLFVCFSEALAQRPRLSRKPPAADEFDENKSVSITGVVRQLEAKSVMIDASDHRFLTFKIEKSTKLPSAELKTGDFVRIQGTQDKEAFLTAKEISIAKAPAVVSKAVEPHTPAAVEPSASPAKTAPTPVAVKPAQPDPEDGGPPRLRRGQPNPAVVTVWPAETEVGKGVPENARAVVEDVSEKPSVIANDAAQTPGNALIERAREWALSFTAGLPNYVCQQLTTRYLKLPGQSGWQAKDVVSANVVYENGKEEYRNIAINGRAQTKRMEDLPGSWSTGEFGTTLRSLFHPGRRAAFRLVKQSQIIGMTASVFDYSVKREYSDWRDSARRPVHHPRIFRSRVDRSESQPGSSGLKCRPMTFPSNFPLDKVESSNDYGLGSARNRRSIHASFARRNPQLRARHHILQPKCHRISELSQV